jgi:hypothetical protein
LPAWRRKRVCAAELAGVWRSGYGNGLRSMTSSAKGPGERCGAHRGLELARETAQGGRRRGPSGWDGRHSRRKTMQGPPCFWSPWVDSWRSCEGPTGVRKVRGSPTARNCKSGAGYQWRSSSSIPARAGLGVEGGSLGELPGGEAKLRWGLAGAGAQQGGRPTAEQRCCTAEQTAGGARDSGRLQCGSRAQGGFKGRVTGAN